MRRLLEALALVLLVALPSTGCAALRPPPPREAFDTGPIADPAVSAPVKISTDEGRNDEDAAIARSSDGRFEVVWSSKRGTRAHLFARSSFDGVEWAAERRLTHADADDFYPALLRSGDGTLHLAWFRLTRRPARMDIWYARSRDGAVWSEPVAITTEGKDWAPALYEDAAGVVWIVWSSRRTRNRELFGAYSTDGGARWSPAAQLTHSPEEDDFPHVVALPNGDRVLVWTRYAAGSPLKRYFRDASAEIVTATSHDGLTWSSPVGSSIPDPRARYTEILPFVFLAEDGSTLYVSWTSDRSEKKGDILVRDLVAPDSPVRQLTRRKGADYDAKIVPTGQPGEYLMLWTSVRKGRTGVFARRIRL